MGEMADALFEDGFLEWLFESGPDYDTVNFTEALRRGVWRTSNGEEIPIQRMTNMHLLNALRRCAAFQHPDADVLTRLNAEWCRRGFAPNAWAENHHVRVRRGGPRSEVLAVATLRRECPGWQWHAERFGFGWHYIGHRHGRNVRVYPCAQLDMEDDEKSSTVWYVDDGKGCVPYYVWRSEGMVAG